MSQNSRYDPVAAARAAATRVAVKVHGRAGFRRVRKRNAIVVCKHVRQCRAVMPAPAVVACHRPNSRRPMARPVARRGDRGSGDDDPAGPGSDDDREGGRLVGAGKLALGGAL